MNCPYNVKICSKCGKILIACKMNFRKAKRSKYGLSSQCKECDKKYREKNKEKNKKYFEQYYKEHKEELTKYKEQYYKEHKEDILEKNRRWGEEHREELLEYKKQWNKENQYKRFNSHNKRRNKLENQGRGITSEQWLEMFYFFDWRCAYSGEYLGGNSEHRTVDHIISLNNGGLNEPWNCIPCYDSYNYQKYTKNMEEWYKQQYFFSEERLQKIYEWQEYAFKKWGGDNID